MVWRRRVRYLTGVVGVCSAIIAPAVFAVVATPSSQDVTPTGALSYTVPLRLPPGRAGVQPSLTLRYSSQGSNGIAGVGWNLEGLSQITRCPATQVVDGIHGSVRLNADDRLCIDGKRMLLAAGTYGQTGAMYYTDVFDGTRIYQVNSETKRHTSAVSATATALSYSQSSSESGIMRAASAGNAGTTTGNGNVAFRVQTKDGMLMEYAPAQVDSGWVARLWLLVRVVDAKGNNWVVTYFQDAANGEYRPTSIQYTLNSMLDSGGHEKSTTSTPTNFNTVQLEYESRPDTTVAWIGGAKLSNTQRLKTIRTLALNAPVTEYRLSYVTSSNSSRSLLSQLDECGSNAGSWTCFDIPLTFTYNEPAAAGSFATTGINWAGHTGGASNNIVGDFNGDGRLDIGLSSGSSWFTCLSTGTTFASCTNSLGHAGGISNNITGDFNGDGRTDIATHVSGTSWQVCQSTKTANADVNFDCGSAYWTGPNATVDKVVVGDFNGDGRTDLATFINATTYQVCMSTGTNFSCTNWSMSNYNDMADLVTGDFDGDGKTDLAWYIPAGGVWLVCFTNQNSNGADCAAQTITTGVPGAQTVVGDFNGDGKTDIAALEPGNTQWKVCYATGLLSATIQTSAFSCGLTSVFTGVIRSDIVTGDFNGDGRTDIAGLTNPTAGTWTVCQSLGNAFSCGTATAQSSSVGSTHFVGDFNGDGVSDLMVYNASGQYWDMRLSNGARTDYMKSVHTGFDITTNIQYASLPLSDRYVQAGVSSYPDVAVTPPMSVVYRVDGDDGVGGRRYLDFWFSSALARADGTGFEGFRQMTVQDASTSLLSQTTYFQGWPYIGMPVAVVSNIPSNAVYSKQVYTNYDSVNTLTGSSCVRSQPCTVLTRSTDEISVDLDGSPLPRVRMSVMTNDRFGAALTAKTEHLNIDGTATGYLKSTTNSYWTDETKWFIDRLIKSTVTSQIP